MEKELFKRYLNDSCSPEEREAVVLWLTDGKNRRQAEELIAELWDQFELQEQDDPVPDFESIRRRAAGVARQENRPDQAINRRWRSFYAAAAIAGFLLTAGWLFFSRQDTAGTDDLITVSTGKGERRWVKLDDGSEIYLNADSRLTYPGNAGVHHAAIYIEGEAFFRMSATAGSRVIKAADIETRTAEGGTAFTISAFPKDSTVTIAVEKGGAELRSTDGSQPMLKLRMPEKGKPDSVRTDSVGPLLKLRPPAPKTMPLIKLRPAVKMEQREYAVIHKQEKNVEVSGDLNEKKLFGWKEGILYFENADSSEWVSTLERWYGVDIRFCDQLAVLPAFSGEFGQANNSLSDVLSQLSTSLRLSYRVDGKRVSLCSKQ